MNTLKSPANAARHFRLMATPDEATRYRRANGGMLIRLRGTNRLIWIPSTRSSDGVANHPFVRSRGGLCD